MGTVYLIVGHYGTGKSEFAVSLAVQTRRRGEEKVAVVDLDVVNPYFRSREAREPLEAEGIEVIGNSLNMDRGVDLPAISPAAAGGLERREGTVIVDLGGDPVGARVIRRFGASVSAEGVEVLYVVNRYRPENRDTDSAVASLRAIEEALGLKVSALVNNSHLLDRTAPQHLLAGDALCREIGERTGLSVRFFGATPTLIERLETVIDAPGGSGKALSDISSKASEPAIAGEPVEIGMYLREEWMASTSAEEPEELQE